MKASEHDIQKAFVSELSLYPAIRQYLFAIANGGSRHMLEAVRLKATGVTPGIPDLFLSIPNKKHGLYLECKSEKGRLSEEQVKKIELFQAAGYECQVFRDPSIGIQYVKDYLDVQNLRSWGQ